MHPKAKRNWFKERADAVRSTAIRPGYKRFTTYIEESNAAWLKAHAVDRKMFITDLIEELINGYRKRVTKRQEKIAEDNR